MDLNDLELVEGSVKDYHPPSYDNWYRNVVIVILCSLIILQVSLVSMKVYQLMVIVDLNHNGREVLGLIPLTNELIMGMKMVASIDLDENKQLEDLIAGVRSLTNLNRDQLSSLSELIKLNTEIKEGLLASHKTTLGMMLMTYDDNYRDKGYLNPVNHCYSDRFFCVMSRGYGPGSSFFKTQFSRCFFSGVTSGEFNCQSIYTNGEYLSLCIHFEQDVVKLPSGKVVNMTASKFESTYENNFVLTCLSTILS